MNGSRKLTAAVFTFSAIIGIVPACRRTPPLQQPVSGQIFVALENRETVKLSATDVNIISADTAADILKQLKSRRDQVKNIAFVQLAIDSWALRDSLEIAEAVRTNNAYRLLLNREKHTGAPEEVARLKSVVDRDSSTFHQLADLAFWEDELQFSYLSKTTTDADGRFSLPASAADKIVFVHTTRKIRTSADLPASRLEQTMQANYGETIQRKFESEHYCWMINLPGGVNELLLRNSNMLDTDASENFASQANRDRPQVPTP
jgi:hypothetical protein